MPLFDDSDILCMITALILLCAPAWGPFILVHLF